MRSLKHLKPHSRRSVEEASRRLGRCEPKVMARLVDTGTQTDPVVVLSLAQAAVLGLISQNEVFGATIAPNGFYTGEPKESPAQPVDGVDYEYADQLIGANGDYLGDNLAEDGQMQPSCSQRRWQQGPPQHPDVKMVIPDRHALQGGDGTVSHIKGEVVNSVMTSCVHMLNNMAPRGGLVQVDPATLRGTNKNCSECEREASNQQQASTHVHPPPTQVAHRGGEHRGLQGQRPLGGHSRGVSEGEEEVDHQGNNVMKPNQQDEAISSYFQTSEVGSYDSGEMSMGPEYEDGSQNMMWTDGNGGGGGQHQQPQPPQPPRRHGGRRVDRLDINIQIDESYCVDVGDGLKRWKCRMCDKSYTSKYNLVTHILGHNGIKPHACPHCGKLFKQPSHLQTHLLTHQGTRPHKCTVCKKGFTQTSHLKRHMLQHTDVKPYSCRFCRRGFAYPSELRAHEVKHERGRCHVCSQCGLEFPTYAHLKRHQTSHQGPHTFQCTECNKSFAYRSQLQNHLLKHQSPRPYTCSQCGLEFVQLHHLRQHSLTHKGMKGHKCEVCSREFTLSANLKRHMLIHNSVRPFQCHVCFKSFIQKQTLKTHMIVHLPVKPFKCKVCGKSFNRMYNLLGHMHLHAGSKPFKCPYCTSKFNLKGNLSRHMKVKHGMDVSPEGQVLPEMESQADYEGQNFSFTSADNMDNSGSQNLTKLTTANMDDMEEYYNFGKDTNTYTTP
ncbi:zinc finger protein 710-like [Phyllopteryx taeniolatus]|uniref:zinc finger protein 710-like n=1 Tax=Phyllopteryx taeniolatus TaxID=161469 RepID=UPI002AD248FA|nr:zinc finger protein 710-like [Phyllopteryx taeniolatus]